MEFPQQQQQQRKNNDDDDDGDDDDNDNHDDNNNNNDNDNDNVRITAKTWSLQLGGDKTSEFLLDRTCPFPTIGQRCQQDPTGIHSANRIQNGQWSLRYYDLKMYIS